MKSLFDRLPLSSRMSLQQQGYSIIPQLVTPQEVTVVSRALDRMALRRAGTRKLFNVSWCRALAKRIKERLAGANVIQTDSVAVQCTIFDKTPSRNWLVALHQDVAIPVTARVDHPQLRGWSMKEGGHFVQPPDQVLADLLAVRVHIDDSRLDNGPLKVVPTSHKLGRLSGRRALEARARLGEAPCLATRGDAILMRPLLLHASSKALAPSRRRVLHVLFGPRTLPYGLEWKHAV